MRTKLVVLSVLVVCVACVARAEQDPWRVRITDWDPNGPILPTYYWPDWHGGHEPAMLPEGEWGEDGGVLRLWYRDSPGLTTRIASYDAVSGAITFGLATAVSVEGWDPGDV